MHDLVHSRTKPTKVTKVSTAYSCVSTMFNNCNIKRFSSLSGHIESAQYLNRDKEKSVIRVVMSNRFQVEEILSEARNLKGGQYSSVYVSKDRTKEERECHKLTVNTLKKKIEDYPGQTWAIVRGSIVDKGPRNV